jgi:hypothetical protein
MAEITNRFKLAAIDLDGTLLGPDHAISEANALAVRRLQAAGIQVVLASGRHFNSMQKYVAALPGVQWVVSCQGGEVSDASRTNVLNRQFLPTAEAGKIMEMGCMRDFSTVAYAVEGVFTVTKSDFEMDFYTELAGHRPVRVERKELLARNIFKVIWMGEPDGLSSVKLTEVVLPTVQAVRTNARFLEFMPTDVSKGTAMATLAQRLGIEPAAAVVFGDGENDIPMFEWAGVSVAMAHGWPLARARAKLVTPDGPAETALARGVDLIFSDHVQTEPMRQKVLFIEAVHAMKDLPALLREHADEVTALGEHTFDRSYIDFLDGQIRLNPRGPEWTERLVRRRANLLPFCGVTLLRGRVQVGEFHFSVEIHSEKRIVIHWEEYVYEKTA